MSKADEFLKKLQMDFRPLPEAGAGPSRIHNWIAGKVPFAMISASRHKRPGLSAEQNAAVNNKNTAELAADLASRKLGGIQIKGFYQEEHDPEPQEEKSFFIPYTGDDVESFKSFITGLVSKYEQDSATFADHEHIGFLTKDGGFVPKFTWASFDPNKIKEFWSVIRGRKFSLLESGSFHSSTIDKAFWKSQGIISDS